MARVVRHPYRSIGAMFLVLIITVPVRSDDPPQATPAEIVEPHSEALPKSGAAQAAPRSIDEEVTKALRETDLSFDLAMDSTTAAGEKRKTVSIALSGDGSRAVTCTPRGECQSWDVAARKVLAKYDGVKTEEDTSFAVAITADGRHALVGGATGMLHVWDAQSGKHVFTHKRPGRVTLIEITRDGKYMAATGVDGKVWTYPVTGGNGWTIETERAAPCTFLALHPRWETLLAGPWNESALLITMLGAFDGERSGGLDLKDADRVKLPVISATISDRCAVLGTSRPEIVVCLPPFTPRGGFTMKFYNTRLDSPRVVRLIDDDATLVAMDSLGRVEYRSLMFLNSPIASRKIDLPEVIAMCVSRDGTTVAYGHEKGFSVWRLPEVPEMRQNRLEELLFRCFVNEDYDKLEAITTILKKEAKPFPWYGRWSRYDLAIRWLTSELGVFWNAKAVDERIKKWRQTRPNSVTAKLVQAQRFIDLAWKARGSGPAFTVTEEGWKVFRANIEETRKLVQPIADSDQPPAEAFPLLFAVAMAQSWERDRVDKYVEKLMRIRPRQDSAHVQVAQLLMPRWSGEKEDSEAYASKIANRIGGAEGDAVYARMALALRPYHRPDTFLEETGFDAERVHKGIDQLAKEAPDDPRVFQEGLFLAFHQRDEKRGKHYLSKLLFHEDDWSLGPWPNHETYLLIKRWAER